MNLVTSCPTCSTLFRVVPDQLRISDGWVRCGQCAKVFDAHLQMQTVATEPAAVVAATGTVPSPPPMAEAQAASAIERTASSPAAQGTDLADATDASLPADASDEAEAVVTPSELSGDSLWPESTPATTLPPPADDGLGELPAFVRAADRRAFWQGRPVRIALAAGSGLLALALGGQVLVQERDRLAAHLPATEPLLQALCVPLGCTLQPWRQIEAMVIDSSAFVKLEPQRYRLTLVLRNTAAVPLALPAIELTLTDSHDQAVIRRVLRPADWQATSPVLAAGGESAASLTVALADGPVSASVAGYRVLAFYP